MANLGTLMPIRFQMLTTARQFKDNIIRAMRVELQKKLTSNAFQNSMLRGARAILKESLESQDEYRDMIAHDGKLRAELGVADSDSAMNSLVRDWVRSTSVKVAVPRVTGSRIMGTVITMTAIQSDYADVLDRAYASYTTERGQQIPWLEWLLTKGVAIMVASHQTIKLPNAVTSRTGTNTVMVKTKGAGWGVPTEYAGTSENNYAQRAILAARSEIEDLFQTQVQRRF